MLPNFIGIGAPRCGSTWLHQMLHSHPQIYVPARRKEVYFFNKYYGRGFSWYEQFFPRDGDANEYIAIGEITPTYMYSEAVARRISQVSSIKRLFLTLRNPVDRLYSEYVQKLHYRIYSGSFADFIKDHPNQVQGGFYADYIKTYLHYYDKSQFLVLVFENAVNEPEATKRRIASFLGVNSSRFPQKAGQEVINKGGLPQHPKLLHIARQCRVFLHRYDLDWIVNLGKAMGLKQRIVGTLTAPPAMNTTIREHLTLMYAEKNLALERMFDLDLSGWMPAAAQCDE